MAKNKGKHGKGKSEIEETDEFVSGVNKAFDRIKPYAKRIGVMVGVVMIGFLAYVVYDWYRDRNEREGTDLFVHASDVMRNQVKIKSDLPPDPTEPKPEEMTPADRKRPTYETTTEYAENTLAQLDKLASKSGGSAAATHGTLLRARALLDLGKFDEAEKAFKDYAADAPTEILRTVAREGVGYVIEARAMANTDAAAREAGLKQALEAFKSMQPKDKGPRWLDAKYHQARILATLGDKARAGELYREILESEPAAGLEDQVNGRLAMLDVAPGAPPPAPSPEDDGADEGAKDDGEGDDAPADDGEPDPGE